MNFYHHRVYLLLFIVGYEDDSKSENSSSDERIEEHDCVVKELQLKQQHPNRLHSELWYNDPGEVSEKYLMLPLLSLVVAIYVTIFKGI